MAHDLAGREAELLALAPGATLATHWEALLGGGIGQGVIVAAGDHDDRAEQVRRLATERVPLLICQPVHSSTLLYLELDMIRRDVGGIVLPYFASRWHPAVTEVREALASGRLGPLEQLVCERFVPARTRATVLWHFMEDVALVRQFLGDVTKVGAMASAAGEAGFANLGVQLTGPSGVLARWSVAPVDDQPGARLTLVGSNGKVTLRMPAGDDVWHVEGPDAAQPPRRFDGAAAAPGVAIDGLVQAITQAASSSAPPDDWADAVRAAQLTEAVERSLRRGRVISLEFDEHTEEGTFKGVMASFGCGLLLLLPVLAAALGALAPRSYGFGKAFFIVLGVGLGVFLLLQALVFLIPKKEQG